MPMPSDQALDVDFAALAIADADFAKIYSANDGRIDFQKPEHTQQLTKSILKRDFGLKLELPSDRLCPPVPVRYQYIRWLQGLLDTTLDSYTDVYDPERQAIGIDIGVGASCIYPLLGCASRPNWRFGGTEVDDLSIESAQRNVSLNGLQSRIRLRKVDLKGPILDLDTLGIKRADFVMCNPPFFTSKEDMLATHESKKRSPSAVCTGADVEMITEGGDLGFVVRMIEESTRLRSRIQWYSSMLGKLASAQAVVKKLKDIGISNWAVTNLQAGNVTRRWAVAWSYDDMRPSNEVARGDTSNKDILPFPTDFTIALTNNSPQECAKLIQKTMEGLTVNWTWNESLQSGLAFARGNVWSRSARRERQRKDATLEGDVPTAEEQAGEDQQGGAALGVRITLFSASKVQIRWVKGTDVVLYESFCGMLKRALLSNEL